MRETGKEREKGHRLRWLEKRVHSETCGQHREEATGGWSRQHDVSCFSVNTGREIGWKVLRWANKWHASDGE